MAKVIHTARSKGVRVAKCPLGQEICFRSCYWRKGKGNRCYFKSKHGRQIPELERLK